LAWSSRLDESERIYSQILKEQDTPDVELEYGRLLSWMGATRGASDTLTTVYEQNKTEESAIALANAKAWGGDREGAIRLLSDFTASHPKATQAQQLLSQMRTSPEILIERIDRAIDLDPFNLALRVQRARYLYDAGRYSEALKTLRFVRDHWRENSEVLDALEAQIKQRRSDEIARLDERRKGLDTTTVPAGMTSSSGNPEDILDLAK